MNKLLKQLIEQGVFDEIEPLLLKEIDRNKLNYEPKTKPDKTIASDIKGFNIAREAIKKVVGSIKSEYQLDKVKNNSYK